MEDEAEQIIQNMRIPEYIMRGAMQQSSDGSSDALAIDPHLSPPKFPTLVFVNSRSGGHRGQQFLPPCRVLLSPLQVVDLNDIQPETVLQGILGVLERLCTEGDPIAAAMKEKLRIIVAGGDGTVGWVLGIIANMNMSHPPPVAPVPLGTGNNFHYSFGWVCIIHFTHVHTIRCNVTVQRNSFQGRKNVGTDLNSVRSLLIDVAKARVVPVDRLCIQAPAGLASCYEDVCFSHRFFEAFHITSIYACLGFPFFFK